MGYEPAFSRQYLDHGIIRSASVTTTLVRRHRTDQETQEIELVTHGVVHGCLRQFRRMGWLLARCPQISAMAILPAVLREYLPENDKKTLENPLST
jgi:hypothetical protein